MLLLGQLRDCLMEINVFAKNVKNLHSIGFWLECSFILKRLAEDHQYLFPNICTVYVHISAFHIKVLKNTNYI